MGAARELPGIAGPTSASPERCGPTDVLHVAQCFRLADAAACARHSRFNDDAVFRRFAGFR
jgi:hypothetical protein